MRRLVILLVLGVLATAIAFGLVGAADTTGATTTQAAASLRAADPEFAFLETANGEPVGWAPCRTIHMRLNPSGAPYPGAVADLERAAAMIGEAAGLDFVFDGLTNTELNGHMDASLTGAGAPLVVQWLTPGATDLPIDAGKLGISFRNVQGDPEARQAVWGMVALNAQSDLQPGFGPGSWGLVMMHELGHLAGLDHVDSPGELMGPGPYPVGLGPGDARGLAHMRTVHACSKG